MARFDYLELGATEQPHKAAHTADEREQSWLQKAEAARRSGQYETALRSYSRALEQDKNLINSWVGQVQMLVLLDEAPEADVWSRKAIELFPGNGELLAARAQATCRTGDTAQALALSDASMAAAGHSGFRWLARGEIMLARRQATDRHCFDQAMQADPDWLAAVEIALVYLHYGRPTFAHTRARQAVERGVDHFYPWFVRGLCEQELGLMRQAQESFGHCLQICPRHHETEQHLRQLQSRGFRWPRFVTRWWS